MSFLPYRTGAIFFPLKNHNNFAAEAAFLCRIVTVVTRFLHSLALARKERSDGIAIVRCKRNRVNDIGVVRLSLGRKERCHFHYFRCHLSFRLSEQGERTEKSISRKRRAMRFLHLLMLGRNDRVTCICGHYAQSRQ